MLNLKLDSRPVYQTASLSQPTNNYLPTHDLKLGYEGFQEIYSNIEKQIKELTELEENWDGEDGMPVSPEIAAFVIQFMHLVMLNLIQPKWVNWQTPHFSPRYDGGITLEWIGKNKRLAIIFKKNVPVPIRAVRLLNGKAFEIPLNDKSPLTLETFKEMITKLVNLITWVTSEETSQGSFIF